MTKKLVLEVFCGKPNFYCATVLFQSLSTKIGLPSNSIKTLFGLTILKNRQNALTENISEEFQAINGHFSFFIVSKTFFSFKYF